MELKEQEVKELMTKEKRKQDKAKRNIRPLKEINFDREHVAGHGGGWKGFRNFTKKNQKSTDR